MTFLFNLNILSRYRAELMGVATLMIILCHMHPNGVVMSPLAARIIGSAGNGCDIFLFLSGMGMWNSMVSVRQKKQNIAGWYAKRYIRIIIPYMLIVIPICISNGNNLMEILIKATGFDFYVYRLALWFVSCILVLYILTPMLDKLLCCERRWRWVAVLISLCILFSYLDLGQDYHTENWQFVVGRFPSYFIGYALAKDIKDSKHISINWLITAPLMLYVILYVLNHRYGCNFNLFWLQGIPIMTIAVLILTKINLRALNSVLAFLGVISLESYATNVLVLPRLIKWEGAMFTVYGFLGTLSLYLIGTIGCIAISIIVNRLSKAIIKKIS